MWTVIIHLKKEKHHKNNKKATKNYKPESHLRQNYFPEKNVML